MKKIVLLFMSLVILSCSEEENFVTENVSVDYLDKSQIMNADLKTQIEYKRHHMFILSDWVSKNGLDIIKENRKNINEFFISDLVEEAIYKKRYSIDDESNAELFDALDAFTDLEGESWYPVVRLSENSFRKNQSSGVIISIEDADENGEMFTHYLPGENDDDLVEVDFEVSEETSETHDFVVVELVNGQPEFLDSDPAGTSGSTTSGGYVSLKLQEMTIRDLKEGWPGRSEIAIKGYKINVQPNIGYLCGYPIFSSVNCGSLSGRRITRLKRSHEDDLRGYDWDIERDEFFYNDVLVYVLFEEDSWPAPQQPGDIPLPQNAFTNIPFRSWQSPYDKKALSNNNLYNLESPNNFSTDNSDVYYKLKSVGF